MIIALAGTAIAAPTAIKSVLDKKEKKQVKNIANKRITKMAPNLSVASAKTAANAQNANHANTADTATTAGNGYLGYARISVTGTVSQAKNITGANVTHPTTGAYCFNGLPFNPQNIQADLDANASLGEISVETPGLGDCANTQAGVFTFNVGTSTRNDRPFFVLFN